MFYDLNVPWVSDKDQMQRTLAFLDELGYNVVALSHTLSGKLPADLTCPISSPLPFRTPASLRVLRRCTLVYSDPSQNHRLPSLLSHYDLVALRPTTERAFQQACQLADVFLVSLDLTVRHPFHFKHGLLRAAIRRGVRFEICYALGLLASGDAASARRNLISNATQLIRATGGGRGIVISSEARTAVGVRAPIDLVNWAVVWGMSGSERGREAVEKEARLLVLMADMRRSSFRGVINVVDGGVAPAAKEKRKEMDEEVDASGSRAEEGNKKRKTEAQLMSKRQAKKARLEAAKKTNALVTDT
ncbi:MAG: hypothetical protein M1816_006036 [Peltula sp. TS41687]|nr:MAG: hypothetical protein M1816_006036 [Peltula sp. TS41687]